MINFVTGKLVKRFSSKTMSAAQKRALAKAVKASALARKKAPTTRVAKKLATISSKLSDTNSALTKLKKGTVSVYRLENKKGQGPLMGNNLRHYAAMPRGTKMGYKVSPVSDYNRRRSAMLKKLAPKGTPFEEIKFKKGDKFAFASVAQSNKYFSEGEQAFLKTRGFNLVRKDNVNLVGSTATQVSYNTNKDIVKLQKDAIKLAKKYEKMSKKV